MWGPRTSYLKHEQRGRIRQSVAPDPYSAAIWDKVTLAIPVHIFNSDAFCAATGLNPPTCPIDASTYANANHPVFDIYEEPSPVDRDFEDTKTIHEAHDARAADHADLSGIVDDPDGLLNPSGPLGEIRTLSGLEQEIEHLMYDLKAMSEAEATSG